MDRQWATSTGLMNRTYSNKTQQQRILSRCCLSNMEHKWRQIESETPRELDIEYSCPTSKVPGAVHITSHTNWCLKATPAQAISPQGHLVVVPSYHCTARIRAPVSSSALAAGSPTVLLHECPRQPSRVGVESGRQEREGELRATMRGEQQQLDGNLGAAN